MKVWEKIYFRRDKLPYNIMARNDRYIICSRKLNRRQDARLLWNEVENKAFFSFTEAYNFYKKYPVYTIVDLEEQIRWTDNYIFSDINYFKNKDCEKLLKRLQKWECEISYRGRIDLDLIK